MASSGKKKTTFAKLARESRLRERRLDKAARKDARKRAAELGPMAEGVEGEETWEESSGEDGAAGREETDVEPEAGVEDEAPIARAGEPDQG